MNRRSLLRGFAAVPATAPSVHGPPVSLPKRDCRSTQFEVAVALLGINGVEDKVHIHDLHATMLHCLGMDHKKLTYRHMGRDFRLTDVSGQVVKKMIV